MGETIHEAYLKAYNGDPVSIFGGIVALNREVDLETAQELAKIFLEIIIAPAFDEDAYGAALPRRRTSVCWSCRTAPSPMSPALLDMKKVVGGLLVQELDTKLLDEELKAGHQACSTGRGDEAAAVRLEGGKAYQVQRHCLWQRTAPLWAWALDRPTV